MPETIKVSTFGEIDALVAERVMKWRACRNTKCEGCNAEAVLHADGTWSVMNPAGKYWSPSTDPRDSRKVMEKARITCIEREGEWWHVYVPGQPLSFAERSLDLAICLATLAAVELQIELAEELRDVRRMEDDGA